jgi:hypothetical protein
MLKIRKFDRKFIGRNKFRFLRGQGYVGVLNTMLLIGLYLHISNIILIIATGILTLIFVWCIGFADDKFKIAHSEQAYSVEQANPYFTEMKEEIRQIKEALNKRTYIRQG